MMMFCVFLPGTSRQLQELEQERKKIAQQLKEKDLKCQGKVLWVSKIFFTVFCETR